MFDRDANVIDQADVKVENQNFIKPSRQALTTINENEPQIAMFLDDNHVAGLIKLRGYPDTYLYVARLLDPRVVAQLQCHGRRREPVHRDAGAAAGRADRVRD